MFIGEVKEKNVVSLAVNRSLNCVWLVSDEGCEDAEVTHSSYNVVPVGFPQVKMSFFRKREKPL